MTFYFRNNLTHTRRPRRDCRNDKLELALPGSLPSRGTTRRSIAAPQLCGKAVRGDEENSSILRESRLTVADSTLTRRGFTSRQTPAVSHGFAACSPKFTARRIATNRSSGQDSSRSPWGDPALGSRLVCVVSLRLASMPAASSGCQARRPAGAAVQYYFFCPIKTFDAFDLSFNTFDTIIKLVLKSSKLKHNYRRA